MKKTLFLSLLAGLVLSSCGSKGGDDYVSVQVDNSQMWSLLDVKSGELKFSDEFFAPASNVVNGAFFVENDDQTFDLYTLEDTKNKLNRDSYTYISNFNPEGYAIVRVADQPWQIVNTKGEVVATVDKTFNFLGGFSTEGLAPFANGDMKIGYINTKGETVIKAKYDNATYFIDGIAFVCNVATDAPLDWLAIDPQGQTVFKIKSGQYENVTPFQNGYAFAIEGDHTVLLDKKGKKVVNVGEPVDMANLTVGKDMFTYSDKQFYGVKDINGEIKIRAKYVSLRFLPDGNLIALNTNGRFGVIDANDEIVVPFDYTDLEYIAPDRYITTSGSVKVLINKEGKEVGNNTFSNVINRSTSGTISAMMGVITSNNNNSDYNVELDNIFDMNVLDMFNDADGNDPNAPFEFAPGQRLELTGEIGTYGIWMNLSWGGDGIVGEYGYVSKKGASLSLNGWMGDVNVIALTEYDKNDVTGYWALYVVQGGKHPKFTASFTTAAGKEYSGHLEGNLKGSPSHITSDGSYEEYGD